MVSIRDKISNRFVEAVVDEAEALLNEKGTTKRDTIDVMTDLIRKVVREMR